MPDFRQRADITSIIMTLPLVLASTSPYRRAQLEQLRCAFTCVTPAINENPLQGENAQQTAERLARLKAEAVASKLTGNSLVIAGDQTACLYQKPEANTFSAPNLCKPLSEARAIEQLEACSGKTVTFFSALCVYNTESQQKYLGSVKTDVLFRELSELEITRYVRLEQPLDCAGSFKCEGLGISLFQSIKSEDPSALIGLPMILLNQFLIQDGFNPLLQSAN